MIQSAIFAYLLIGFLIGIVAGCILASTFAVAHPMVLERWERYRMAKESRRKVSEAIAGINSIVREHISAKESK